MSAMDNNDNNKENKNKKQNAILNTKVKLKKIATVFDLIQCQFGDLFRKD